MRRFLLVLLFALLLAVPAGAQTFVRLSASSVTDTISSNGDEVILTNFGIGGFGSVKVQALDSYSGTWEVQCATNGTVVSSTSITGATFDTASELKMTPSDTSTVATSVTDTVAIYDVQNAAGCRAIKVISTAGFAASDTSIVISAWGSGGGGGGGGGSGGGDITINGSAPDTNTGTDGAQTLRVTEASDSPLSVDADAISSTATSILGDTNTLVTGLLTEDVASAGAEKIQGAAFLRRDTTPSSSCGTAGDFCFGNVDANGRLYVQSVLYDAAGAAISLASDPTLDAAIGTSGPLIVTRGSTATPAAMSTDGDATAVWTDLNGRLHIKAEGVEDAVAVSGDHGIPVLCVREDTAPTGSGAAGDYIWPKCDANGRSYVNATLYTAAGAAITTGTDYTQDVALTVATTAGPMTVGRGSSTPPTAVGTADDAVVGWFGLKGAQATFTYGLDPCASDGIDKSSAVLNVTADAIVVALTSTQTIYVCGFAVTVGGTAPTFFFDSGTGSACATSNTVITGTYLPVIGSPIVYGGGSHTLFKGDVSEDLCVNVGGTTPSVQGVLTYVKMVPPTL